MLVDSHTTLTEVLRITSSEVENRLVTMSEAATFEFAKGLAVTNYRAKRLMSREGHRIASPDPVQEASRWAKELDEWAMLRERVLTTIDLRAARRARSLSSEIRRAADRVLDLTERRDSDVVGVAPMLDELAALRLEAVELMLGAVEQSRRSTLPPPTSCQGQ